MTPLHRRDPAFFESQLDVPNAVDDLRRLIAKADAPAYATEDLFDQVIWVEDDDQRCRLERLAW